MGRDALSSGEQLLVYQKTAVIHLQRQTVQQKLVFDCLALVLFTEALLPIPTRIWGIFFLHICWWHGICDDANSDTELKSFKGFCNFLLYGFRDSSTSEIINLQRTSVSPRVNIQPACVLATYRSEFRALSWLTSISKDVWRTLPTLSLSYGVFVISYHFIPCKIRFCNFISLHPL